jgi:3-methylfumaryl-CoA hydratase
VTDVVERSELIGPEPAEALAKLLSVPLRDPASPLGLPLLWHWLYLLDRPAEDDLGPDGHAVRGTIPVPPRPGCRRVMAGGWVRSLAPLRCGRRAERRTRLISSEDKTGSRGRVTFVRVGHEIVQDGMRVIEEWQEVAYRDPTSSPLPVESVDRQPPPAPADWTIDVTPTLLFRFSALTYNGYRIHYDRDYVREVEGVPALVTHGPLQALVMAEAARAQGVTPVAGSTFRYRFTAPLFDFQGLVVRATPRLGGVGLSVRDLGGRQTATADLDAPDTGE